MNNWRKKGGNCYQEFARTKFNNYNNYRKPPTGGNPNWQQNVPYWEKSFVSSVGSLSWKKFLERKEFTHLYNDILKWDDSAGKEAFETEKDRFYANFHGLPCDVHEHNPDLYIDQIDWNAQVDQNLILDLESESVEPDVDSNHDPVVIFGDVLPDPYKDFSPYGWGDVDDNKIKESWGVGDEQNGINWNDYIVDGRIIWDDWDVQNGNNWWGENENDNKAGDEAWNTNTYDNNNYYYPSYGNVNNKRFNGNNNNNNQRSRSWKNNGGNGTRSTGGRGYGNQHGHGSTLQEHGSQRIRVHP